MAETSHEILESIDRGIRDINRAMYGGKTPLRGTKPEPGTGFTPQTKHHMGMFSNSLRDLVGTFKQMSGSADNLLTSLGRLGRNFLALDLLVDVVKGGVELGKQFSKLTNIGQFFGGSMFEMARQAGESGLSLKQFSDMLERNSIAAAVMNKGQGDIASGMGNLQKGVRETLKSVGFYGMSLVQLDNNTTDYMETLRQTGQLNRMNDEQQRRAVVSLMGDVSAFSIATGKSREEILKGVNAAMRDTSAAMRMATHGITDDQRQAFTRISAMFSSLPGQAGDMLPKFFAQMFGQGGNAFFTEMGKTFITAGMPEIPEMMRNLVEGMNANQPIEQIIHTAMHMRDAIVANDDALQNLANSGMQEAAQIRQVGQAMLGLDEKDLILKAKKSLLDAEQQKVMNKATLAVQLFESQFHTVTGAFATGFYSSFGEMMKDFDTGSDTVKKLTSAFEKIGTIFGKFLGKVFNDDNLNKIGGALEGFGDWLDKIVSDSRFAQAISDFDDAIFAILATIGEMLKGVFSPGNIKALSETLPPLIRGIGEFVKNLAWAITGIVKGVHSFFENFLGMSSDKAWFATLLTALAAKLFASLFKTFFALNVTIFARNVNAGGGGPDIEGPEGKPKGAPKGTPKGAPTTKFGRAMSRVGRLALTATRFLGTGLGLYGLGSSLYDLHQQRETPFFGNEETGGLLGSRFGNYATSALSGATIGAAVGAPFFGVGAGVGAAVGGAVGLIAAGITDLAGRGVESAKKGAEDAAQKAVEEKLKAAEQTAKVWKNQDTGLIETDPLEIAKLEKRSPSVLAAIAGLTPKPPEPPEPPPAPTPPEPPEPVGPFGLPIPDAGDFMTSLIPGFGLGLGESLTNMLPDLGIGDSLSWLKNLIPGYGFDQPAVPTAPATPTAQTPPDVTTWGDTLKNLMPSIGDSLKSDFDALTKSIDRQTEALAQLLIRNNSLTENSAKPGVMDYLMMPF